MQEDFANRLFVPLLYFASTLVEMTIYLASLEVRLQQPQRILNGFGN